MADLAQAYEVYTRPGPDYVDAASATVAPASAPLRLIAYYLPQFHAIPANDAWWWTSEGAPPR